MGEKYSKISEAIFRYGDAMSDDQKIELVDFLNNYNHPYQMLNNYKLQDDQSIS